MRLTYITLVKNILKLIYNLIFLSMDLLYEDDTDDTETKSDENRNNRDKEEYDENINKTRHGKSVDNLAGLYINSDTENDTSKESKINNFSKYEVKWLLLKIK